MFRVMRRQRTNKKHDIRWIDDFVRSIKPHVYVRRRDGMLILMPNQCYHLNDSGLYMLERALKGNGIRRILDEMLARDQQGGDVLDEVEHFFFDLRALVMGCLHEGIGHKAVEQVPFRPGEGLLPVLSEVALTYRCNLSCRFCYAGCTCTRKPDAPEMPFDEVKAVLRKIRHEAEVPSVSFTGGEPTLRNDLCAIIRYATDIGLRVNLITNGTNITKQLVRRLKRSGLRSAQVSIEGPNSELHDMLTTVPGAFERAAAGVRLLQEQGIYVHTNTTINRLNVDHVEGMADLARSLGLPRFSMNMVMPCGSTDTGETALRYSDIGEAVTRVKRHARDLGIEFMWYSPTPYCLFNPIAEGLGSKSCAACDGLLSIAPNGDVLPCSSLMRPVGNLLRQSFESVWNSEAALFHRRRMHAPDRCRKCGRFDICSGACPIYWDAFGCGEIADDDGHTDKT